MNWDNLPDDLVRYILFFRKLLMCNHPAATKIQSVWNCYRIRVLIGRFHMLRYLKDFKKWNPTINEFLKRSRL
uniref:Uncharacterized protein n=1 Tax=viral metagenome TaxID=1070528 RepID=A0A6C0AZ98_9ZZZZ|tara:strand:- start:521 stop:739 length:219 start_codon:yes stop_codon:yes gene_type:complete